MKKIFILCSILILAFSQTPSHAASIASFDCKKASRSIEKLVCTDIELDLQWADRTLAQYYKEALGNMPDEAAQQLKQDQRAWLKTLGPECDIQPNSLPAKSADQEKLRLCLLDHYEKRNRKLLNISAQFKQNKNSSLPDVVKEIKSHETRGYCPISKDHDISYYETVASDQYARSDIFFEIPNGLVVEEHVGEFKAGDLAQERNAPSLKVPSFNQINPFHGTGDWRMRIYCRVRDHDGNWWLANKDNSTGAFSYFLESEFKPYLAGQ